MFNGWKDSSILVVQNNKNTNENFFSVKIQRISFNVSPFTGISLVNQSFNKSALSQLRDNERVQRVKTVGFSYSEIVRNFTNVLCSGGSCAEDIQTHLGKHLKSLPGNNVPSADTSILNNS